MDLVQTDSKTDKYLALALEGAEATLPQIDGAIQQMTAQLRQLEERREEAVTAINDLKELLGLEDEDDEDVDSETQE